MKKYIDDFIKYSIMNCDSAHNGDSRKANYANDKLRKIEMTLKELGEAEKFIDEVISTTKDPRVLGWICSYAIEINYDLPKIKRILTNIIRSASSLDALGAKILLKSIDDKNKKI